MGDGTEDSVQQHEIPFGLDGQGGDEGVGGDSGIGMEEDFGVNKHQYVGYPGVQQGS